MKSFNSFRLDTANHCLWHEDQRVSITPKAYDVLRYLVEHPERLVTPDEILEAIWSEVYVNPEVLRKYILEIRKALGDRPDDPRFVETVPKRGYRFIAPVHDESTNAASDAAIEVASSMSGIEPLPSELGARQFEPLPAPAAAPVKGHHKFWRIGVLLTVLLLAVLIVDTYRRSVRAAKLTNKDTVVLADFANRTGDAVFDGTLRQGLSAQLEQSPFLNLLSDARIAQSLSLMAQPRDTRLTGELAREVCQRTASAATIDGSIANLGSQYVMGLKALNCRNGDLLAEEQVTADGKEHVLNALGEAATKLRTKLGESLASVQKYDAPPDSVTTASLEALQAYSLAYREMVVQNNYAAAVPLFRRATSLDPNFAMAYARLGTNYFYLGEAERGAENIRRAYDLRKTVSERERFYIDSHYEMFVSGNVEAGRKTLELWSEIYPRDEIPPNNLGFIYTTLGDYDKGLAAYQDAFRLDPGSGNSYSNLVIAYLNIDRLGDARAMAQQAQARHLETPILHQALYFVDFLQHDAAGMQREVDSQAGMPGSEDTMLYYESDTAAYSGHFAKARELTARAIDSAQHADEKETAATYEAERAVREAMVGNMGIAKQRAQAALVSSKGRDVKAISAIALALAGDSAHATPLADDLAERFPEDTMVQFNYLPTIHAANAIESGSATRAIQALAPAAPYELGGPGNQSLIFCLYPVYLRGVAFLAARQGPAAAAEFQKILYHPAIVVNEPIGALARLGLGRAYVLSGERQKARDAYQDFLMLWKDADPDIPILTQAKAEYAKLK